MKAVRIEKIVAGGDGLGTIENRAIFIPFVAAGETVEAEIVETRPGYFRGRAVRIVEAARERVQPPCAVYGSCGGCNLQHLAYPAQLREKLNIVREAFSRIGHIELDQVSMVPGPELAYRNRVQVHPARGGGYGFQRHRSHDVVKIDNCPVAVPEINRLLADPATQIPRRRTTVIGAHGVSLIEGAAAPAQIDVLGIPVLARPELFFQSNLRMLELLIQSLCAGVGAVPVLELYSGVGALTAHLARFAALVDAVEADARSSELARRNALGNPRIRVHATSVEQWISTNTLEEYALVVVDPPRTGLSGSVRSQLVSQKPCEIRYVSCDPVSLARDAGALVAAGYRIEECTLFDFYPQTSHIESLTRFLHTCTESARTAKDTHGPSGTGPDP